MSQRILFTFRLTDRTDIQLTDDGEMTQVVRDYGGYSYVKIGNIHDDVATLVALINYARKSGEDDLRSSIKKLLDVK